ncbi:hypothetical protein Tco_1481704, partial [Tanacetum coccineum]
TQDQLKSVGIKRLIEVAAAKVRVTAAKHNLLVSVQVVAAAKLLVLNPGEFELWKMRIEQYFLMTDCALWEVILNSDSPSMGRNVTLQSNNT